MWIHACRLFCGNLLAIGCCFILPFFSNHLDAAETVTEFEPFLKTYCVSCHGEEKQKGAVSTKILQYTTTFFAVILSAQASF